MNIKPDDYLQILVGDKLKRVKTKLLKKLKMKFLNIMIKDI